MVLRVSGNVQTGAIAGPPIPRASAYPQGQIAWDRTQKRAKTARLKTHLRERSQKRALLNQQRRVIPVSPSGSGFPVRQRIPRQAADSAMINPDLPTIPATGVLLLLAWPSTGCSNESMSAKQRSSIPGRHPVRWISNPDLALSLKQMRDRAGHLAEWVKGGRWSAYGRRTQRKHPSRNYEALRSSPSTP